MLGNSFAIIASDHTIFRGSTLSIGNLELDKCRLVKIISECLRTDYKNECSLSSTKSPFV